MKREKLIGIGVMTGIFLALFILMASIAGFKITLWTFIATTIITRLLVFAMYLIKNN